MFKFFNRLQPRAPTIRQALVQAGVVAAADPASIAVVETRGVYSGRPVTFFRAFEPASNPPQGTVKRRAFSDLDAHHDLLVGSGHVEHGGMVIVDRRSGLESAPPARQPADRAAHADDEHLVFWDADLARSSAATLSAPAASWLHARQTKA